MTLTELQGFDIPNAWARLTPEQQAEIGTAAIGQFLAELVHMDDGSETTHADREEAGRLMDQAVNALPKCVEAAFPEITWWIE